jgi:Cu-Zn family superoxide dismutase
MRMSKVLVATVMAIAGASVATAQQPAPSRPLMLFYDWGKPDIRSDDTAVLDEAVAAWRANPSTQLVVSGHSDRSGRRDYNLRSSKRRAELVRSELIKRGVTPGSVKIAAYGEDRPLVPTEDGVREVQNRRVEIDVGGAGPSPAGSSTSGMLVPFPIVGPNGEARGFASFFSEGEHAELKVQAKGLAPGVHGIHLHSVGRCEGPDFKSAGAHWNPGGRQHGLANPEGAHLGDLPNLTVAADGTATATFHVAGDIADADGTALVIHADPDDNKTDPSGNSGARVACAVLTSATAP